MSVVVQPSARGTFTPRELTDAYERFKEHGPQYLSDEAGLKASAYRFGERVLLVYEEAETGVVVLIHPIAWEGNSAISGYLKRVPQTRTSNAYLKRVPQRLGTYSRAWVFMHHHNI
jgi:hypothetical protein